MMTNQAIAENLIANFGDSVKNFEEPHGLLTLSTNREQIIPILTHLWNGIADGETVKFQFLTDICGIHFPNNKGEELGVIYHVNSLESRIRIRIKVFLSDVDPHIPTATTIYPTANWMERETFDFFGIIFDGHPNLKRILNIEEMDYHPMRKEYALEDATREDKIDALFGR